MMEQVHCVIPIIMLVYTVLCTVTKTLVEVVLHPAAPLMVMHQYGIPMN